MVTAAAAPKETNSVEDNIRRRVFDRIGGVPQGFIRMTVNRIFGNTYRANVYVEDRSKTSELCFVKSPTIAHSMLMESRDA